MMVRRILVAVVVLGLTVASTPAPAPEPCGKVSVEFYEITDLVYVCGSMGTNDYSDVALPEVGISEREFPAEIRRTIAPGRWEQETEWAIFVENGILILRAPPHIHAAVKRYLLYLCGRAWCYRAIIDRVPFLR